MALAYRGLASTEDAVRRYVNSVPAEGTVESVAPMLTLALTTQAQVAEIMALTGIDIAGFDFALDASAIRHAFTKHGDVAFEASRGQRAINLADFQAMLAMLDSADRVTLLPPKGPVLQMQIEKVVGGERRVVIFDLRTGRRRLSLATLWVMMNGRPLPNTPLTSP